MAGKQLAIKRKCGQHESPARSKEESGSRLHCICPVGRNQRFCRAPGKKLFPANKKRHAAVVCNATASAGSLTTVPGRRSRSCRDGAVWTDFRPWRHATPGRPLSYSFASERTGSSAARFFCSMRSATTSHNSHRCSASRTSFQFPSRIAQLPPCSQHKVRAESLQFQRPICMVMPPSTTMTSPVMNSLVNSIRTA